MNMSTFMGIHIHFLQSYQVGHRFDEHTIPAGTVCTWNSRQDCMHLQSGAGLAGLYPLAAVCKRIQSDPPKLEALARLGDGYLIRPQLAALD